MTSRYFVSFCLEPYTGIFSEACSPTWSVSAWRQYKKWRPWGAIFITCHSDARPTIPHFMNKFQGALQPRNELEQSNTLCCLSIPLQYLLGPDTISLAPTTTVHRPILSSVGRKSELLARLVCFTAACLRSCWPNASSSAALLESVENQNKCCDLTEKLTKCQKDFVVCRFATTKLEKIKPIPKALRQKWLKKCCLHEFMINTSSKVCHLHFLKSDYEKIKLKNGTVPSQNLPVGHFETITTNPYFMHSGQTKHIRDICLHST